MTSVLDPDELEAFASALRKVRAAVRPDADPASAGLAGDEADGIDAAAVRAAGPPASTCSTSAPLL